jgi:hypothetical protein
MSIKITIPNSSSDVLTFGSGNTPTAAQIAGIDSGSSNGQLAFYTTASGTSTERVRVDASGNVGIGTVSPATTLHLRSAVCNVRLEDADTSAYANVGVDNSGSMYLQADPANSQASSTMYFSVDGTERMRIDSSGSLTLPGKLYAGQYQGDGTNDFVVMSNNASKPIVFYTGVGGVSAVERARIDSSGNLLVGTTSSSFGTPPRIETRVADGRAFGVSNSGTGTATAAIFLNNVNSAVGSITYTTTTTSYVTSSDYRLKDSIAPMTGALATVAQLKPCTYKWKTDGSDGQGFIAHELQAVVPDAVTGEKDAVDAEGNPVYQGIDTSFLVATLTAAIQEQQAIITSLTDRVSALDERLTALENK